MDQRAAEQSKRIPGNHSVDTISTDDGATCLARAEALIAQSKLQDAEKELLAALAHDPGLADAHYRLGLLQQDRGDLRNALESFKRAAEAAPGSIQTLIDLGRLQYRMNQVEDAEATLSNAVDLSPHHPIALFNLGHVYRRRGNLDAAKDCFQRAIDQAPQYALAHEGLAYVYRSLGRKRDAQEKFKTAYFLLEPYLSFPMAEARSLWDRMKATWQVLRTSVPALRATFKWYFWGRRDDDGFVKYRVLHQITNGKVTDTINPLIRLRARFRKGHDVSLMGDSVLPGGPNLDIAPIVAQLKERGVYVFPKLLDPELVEQAVAVARRVPSRPYPKPPYGPGKLIYDPTHPLAPIHQFDDADLVQEAVLQRFIFDPAIIGICRSYFGVMPRLANLSLWYSTAFDDLPSSYGAQMYHVDFSSLQFLKLFVYLTDVTPETGPHSIVPYSHKPDRRGQPLRRRGLVRICDEDMLEAYGKDGVLDIIGPKGTVFIADTRAFHKGTNPIAGDRLVLQLVWSNDAFGFSEGEPALLQPAGEAQRKMAMAVPEVYSKFKLDLSPVVTKGS